MQQIVLITVPASLHASQQPELRDDFSEEEEVRFVSNYAPLSFRVQTLLKFMICLNLLLGMIHHDLLPYEAILLLSSLHYILCRQK